MIEVVRYFLMCALFVTATKANVQGDEGDAVTSSSVILTMGIPDETRGLASTYGVNDKYGEVEVEEEPLAAFKKRAKPLKNIFMGIYKNYKSTYLGNKTTNEYKKILRERLNMTMTTPIPTRKDNDDIEPIESEKELIYTPPTDTTDIVEQEPDPEKANTEIAPTMESETETVLSEGDEKGDYEPNATRKRRKRKRKNSVGHSNGVNNMLKRTHLRPDIKKSIMPVQPEVMFNLTDNDNIDDNDEYHYNVGPGLNVSLDMTNDIVHVKLDGENLKEIVAARWLNDDLSEEGRGKKYEMVTKVLPLFILPFLIQSAIVPFLVTKLKLLLVKSILVGKLAIFLLIISAIRNSNKVMQSYEVAPSYWASEPSRRSELAAAASSAAYNGYRVEGKPTTWIN